MDISADLTELSRTPVTVVSSGVKSILDIPKTLEVLETLGVPVCGYKTKEFPGFFTNVTGVPSPMVLDSALDAALMMYHSRKLGLPNGMLVAVPNPSPATLGSSNEDISKYIEEALMEAHTLGIEGAAITPFLLKAVGSRSGGRTVDSNVALVCNNAKVASMIAKEYSTLMLGQLGSEKDAERSHFVSFPSMSKKIEYTKHVVVVGGMVIDHVVRPTAWPLIMKTSNPGTAQQSFGGVGRNIAEAVASTLKMENRCDTSVQMVSVVGDDAYGSSLMQHTHDLGIDVSNVLRDTNNLRTASYTAVHDHSGDLLVAVADMDILKSISVTGLRAALQNATGRMTVVADGNMSMETFSELIEMKSDHHFRLFFEPTSVPKCTLPVLAQCLNEVT